MVLRMDTGLCNNLPLPVCVPAAAATTVDETSVSDQPGHRQSCGASRKPSMQPQTEEPAAEDHGE